MGTLLPKNCVNVNNDLAIPWHRSIARYGNVGRRHFCSERERLLLLVWLLRFVLSCEGNQRKHGCYRVGRELDSSAKNRRTNGLKFTEIWPSILSCILWFFTRRLRLRFPCLHCRVQLAVEALTLVACFRRNFRSIWAPKRWWGLACFPVTSDLVTGSASNP